MSKIIDLTGQKFGRLIVIGFHSKNGKRTFWNCLCECGNEKTVRGENLRSGNTKSCGCLHDEMARQRRLIHGHTSKRINTSEYVAWASMKRRCYYEHEDSYQLYGGRGIKVCDRWLHSFDNFYADMGPKPSPIYSLDRKNSNGNYEPDNCKWSTNEEQARNQRVQKNSKSGIKGVRQDKTTGKWIARIYHNGKSKYLGYFANLEDAVRARKEAEIKYWNKKPS